MLRFTLLHEGFSMTFLDHSPRDANQLALLKDAARNNKGMLALLIPLSQEDDQQELKQNPDDLTKGLKTDPPPLQMRGSAASLAGQFLRLRRQRDKIFGPGIFADPAWDMLLDLFLAQEKNLKPISISSLCIAAAVPSTTALRWIETLVQQGLVSKQADPRDKRRTFISLTEAAWKKMQDLLMPLAEAR